MAIAVARAIRARPSLAVSILWARKAASRPTGDVPIRTEEGLPARQDRPQDTRGLRRSSRAATLLWLAVGRGGLHALEVPEAHATQHARDGNAILHPPRSGVARRGARVVAPGRGQQNLLLGAIRRSESNPDARPNRSVGKNRECRPLEGLFPTLRRFRRSKGETIPGGAFFSTRRRSGLEHDFGPVCARSQMQPGKVW